ncbi:MAG: hypothetical protein LLG01_02800 [Planctomycetaceae bacterium]|nr:hypothetical protein [Planctomycetaceae bacterium]
MSYSTASISYLDNYVADLTRIVRAACRDSDTVVQCYVSGQLVDWRTPAGGVVEFVLPDMGPSDVVLLLAVSDDQVQTNLWAEAMAPSAGSSRLSVAVPLTMSLGVDSVVRILLGTIGSETAVEVVFEQAAFPAGRGAGGFGLGLLGEGGFGWDGAGAAGWGYGCGVGEYGFDCQLLRWTSEPLPPGTYPIAVIVEDEQGSEIARHEALQQLDAPARPASDLRVQLYDAINDALTLAWTQSPDIG